MLNHDTETPREGWDSAIHETWAWSPVSRGRCRKNRKGSNGAKMIFVTTSGWPRFALRVIFRGSPCLAEIGIKYWHASGKTPHKREGTGGDAERKLAARSEPQKNATDSSCQAWTRGSLPSPGRRKGSRTPNNQGDHLRNQQGGSTRIRLAGFCTKGPRRGVRVAEDQRGVNTALDYARWLVREILGETE